MAHCKEHLSRRSAEYGEFRQDYAAFAAQVAAFDRRDADQAADKAELGRELAAVSSKALPSLARLPLESLSKTVPLLAAVC
eukprot:SAG22_NODE_22177_length_251_cov_0.559211_1_plen_80_part_10